VPLPGRLVSVPEGNKRTDRHLQGRGRASAELGQVDDEAGRRISLRGAQQLHGSLGRTSGCDQIVHEKMRSAGRRHRDASHFIDPVLEE